MCYNNKFEQASAILRLISASILIRSIMDVIWLALFLLSIIVSYGFVLIGIYVLRQNRKEKLNILAAIEYFSFAWWSLFYALIYIAQTAGEAMLWHRLASVGWVLFCPVATHFFFTLSNRSKSQAGSKKFFYLLLYILPAAVIINAFFNPAGTSVATGFMQVQGVGWVYEINIRSPWYWLYLLHITVYFTICLKKHYSWAISSGRRRFIRQAKSILLLKIIVLIVGAFWELILPALYPRVPPACHFFAFFWALGFLYIIKALKLTSPEDAATPDIILKTVMDPIVVLNNVGIIIKCNKATEQLLKLKAEQIVGKSLSDFFAAGENNHSIIDGIYSGKQIHSIEIDLIDSAQVTINTTASFSLAETKLDGPIGIVASFHDITALKKIEKELKQRIEKNLELSKQLEVLANYDTLTGLPNRRLFWAQVDVAVNEYLTSGKEFALFFIDLDGFKKINDLYGHDIGDRLLQKCSKMFKATVRKNDVIARFGGDEFIILFDKFDDAYIEGLVLRLKDAFEKPIIVDDYSCSIGLSLGISKCPVDGTSGAELIKCADNRMYNEKQNKSII